MNRLGAAELVLDARADLGEGPVWHDGELHWVNINAGEIHRYSPDTRADQMLELGRSVGAAVPRATGGYVAASADAFIAVSPDGSVQTIATIEIANANVRMNDGKCDPAGRFWAGTMNVADPMSGDGNLYVLDTDGNVRHVLDDVRISNGLGWSPDHNTMYFVDSLRGIDAFDYDVGTGEISGRRTIAEIPLEEGVPDGMCTDAEGHLWVAMWGGYCVRRYAPDGGLVGIVETDARQTSSCAFGGEDLMDLYITSATTELDADELAKHPGSGGMFRFRADVPGQPLRPYAG